MIYSAILALATPVQMIAAMAPPAPLPTAKSQFYENFFTALPSAFPADNLDDLRKYVAVDLVVYFENEERFSNREEWLNWLNAMAVENRVERTLMSREEFFFQSDNRILVREFWYPYREGVVFHPEFPHKLVSYQFKRNKLIRVDYLADIRPMNGKPGANNNG